MDAELVEPNLLAAQALKVSILRLEQHRPDIHSDDMDFHEASLVIVLGRLNTPEAREAFVDLFDFSWSDMVANAIGYVVAEFKKDLMPVMRARIGRPLCPQAIRSPEYGRGAMTIEQRDRLLRNWLTDLEHDS